MPAEIIAGHSWLSYLLTANARASVRWSRTRLCLLNVAVRRKPPGYTQKPEGLRPSATIVHLFQNK